MRLLLNGAHAVQANFVTPVASFAIAVRQRLNEVPNWPATCTLLWFWQ